MIVVIWSDGAETMQTREQQRRFYPLQPVITNFDERSALTPRKLFDVQCSISSLVLPKDLRAGYEF